MNNPPPLGRETRLDPKKRRQKRLPRTGLSLKQNNGVIPQGLDDPLPCIENGERFQFMGLASIPGRPFRLGLNRRFKFDRQKLRVSFEHQPEHSRALSRGKTGPLRILLGRIRLLS
jgi:hypothetical protein